MGKVVTSARVQVVVEVSLGDKWGADCKIDQVHEQAASTAVGYLRNLFQKEPDKVQIIGLPKTIAVLVWET